jgi:hypothetical protein
MFSHYFDDRRLFLSTFVSHFYFILFYRMTLRSNQYGDRLRRKSPFFCFDNFVDVYFSESSNIDKMYVICII